MLEEKLRVIFGNIEDKRSWRNQRHPFLSLLGIALLGALAGIDSFSGLGDFAEAHEENLRKLFDLPNGVPSHDTFQRLFDAINPDQFAKQFSLFTKALADAVAGIIAIDGKTIRNSGTNKALHIVSAWCEANELVLGQIKVEQKSNEIPAIPLLLELLDISGRIITIDAMGCQREIAAQIIKQDGDYVLGLKGNQSALYDDVATYFEGEKEYPCWKEYDKGHGRLEERVCYATDDIDWLIKEHNWPGLKSIAKVVSKRVVKEKESVETRYYISSLAADPEKICKAARSHWGVENKLHWRLDVVFNEDKCCIRDDNAAENMDIMRKWALNIISKYKGKSSMKSVQRKVAMSFAFMKDLLLKTFHA